MPRETTVPLGEDFLLIRGEYSFLLVGRACSRFTLFIETCSGEHCQTVEPDDLVAVSSPEGGSLDAARMLLELVRRHHVPLVVLPKGHPGSTRLQMVVAVSDAILLACEIQRGTHPEQHLLCSSAELAGMRLRGAGGAVEIAAVPPHTAVEVVPFAPSR